MAKPWIREVILENFMSYEYARIPLKEGINLICGPNGAGKSSILLAISIALGQIYTERSKRLKDLIRRGKDVARVTLIFDNMLANGRRPIPFSQTDTFMLSRYLKKDGTYWYEADYKEISSHEVDALFRKFGMNPDNMLIIMHQNTLERFGLISPEEKLVMLEDAVGFSAYRKRIQEATEKLKTLMGEGETMAKLLGRAEENLEYWTKMHERYQERTVFRNQKTRLKKELIWAQILRRETQVDTLKMKQAEKEKNLQDLTNQVQETYNRITEAETLLAQWQSQLMEAFYTLLALEKENVTAESSSKEKINHDEKSHTPQEKDKELHAKIEQAHAHLGSMEKHLRERVDTYIKARVEKEILNFKKSVLAAELTALREDVEKAEKKLQELDPLRKRAGRRIATERTPGDIEGEIKMIEARIVSLGEIPPETEETYIKVTQIYQDVQEKSRIVGENKAQGLKELRERQIIWKDAITNLLEKVTPSYQEMLSAVGATGLVKLVHGDSIEKAGLELMVGFRGVPPTLLDAYTQSGGERTASVVAFLLSLQKYLKSPFRAIDEFDIHMDPRNREAIYQQIVSSAQGYGQSIIITPSQITMADPGVHVIVVQNTYGKSGVNEVHGKN